jgi:hypothetical protein
MELVDSDMNCITAGVCQFFNADVDLAGPLRPDIVVGGVYEFYQGTVVPARRPIDGDEYDIEYYADSTIK